MSNYMLTSNASAYKETNHPTEKPLKLIKHLIKVNLNEGEILLDMFMGSGTTAVASEILNRKWIGIEISSEYCALIKRQVEKALMAKRQLSFWQKRQ